jgi:pantoate--beta-alanine ligase
MLILRRIDEVRTFSRGCRAAGEPVALVPTMGYLHRGHLSLIALARERARRVIVSIFVNPKQFGPSEDFASYPRDFERDRNMCEEAGADALFAPEASEIYPPGHATRVSVEGPLTARLCGASRPGHFTGVATVVAKLFTICEPDVAVFGQKDAQQAAVIRRMTKDLDLPVEIVVAPIVREADGLAMSSRNVYLGAEERAQATILHRALSAAEDLVSRGERDGERLLAAVRSVLSEAPLARTDYAELVDPQTLETVSRLERPALLALAVFFGKTRLIDNTVLRPAQGS